MAASCAYADELPICAPEAPWICPSIEVAPARSKLTGVTRIARDCSSTGVASLETSARADGSLACESAGDADRTSTQPRTRRPGTDRTPPDGRPPFLPRTRALTPAGARCFIGSGRKPRYATHPPHEKAAPVRGRGRPHAPRRWRRLPCAGRRLQRREWGLGRQQRPIVVGPGERRLEVADLVGRALHLEVEVLVLRQARAGGDQPTHDDVLLEATEVVHLAVDRGLGEHLRRLLERRCRGAAAPLRPAYRPGPSPSRSPPRTPSAPPARRPGSWCRPRR